MEKNHFKKRKEINCCESIKWEESKVSTDKMRERESRNDMYDGYRKMTHNGIIAWRER